MNFVQLQVHDLKPGEVNSPVLWSCDITNPAASNSEWAAGWSEYYAKNKGLAIWLVHCHYEFQVEAKIHASDDVHVSSYAMLLCTVSTFSTVVFTQPLWCSVSAHLLCLGVWEPVAMTVLYEWSNTPTLWFPQHAKTDWKPWKAVRPSLSYNWPVHEQLSKCANCSAATAKLFWLLFGSVNTAL